MGEKTDMDSTEKHKLSKNKKNKKRKRDKSAVNTTDTSPPKAAKIEPAEAFNNEISEDQSSPQQTEPKRKKDKEKIKEKKMKKQKEKLEASKPNDPDFYLEYLKEWESDRSSWKFNKHKQTWLLNHLYDTDKIPDDSFSTLLSYMEESKGQARQLTSEKAEEIMKADLLDEESKHKQARARQVVQRLALDAPQ